MLDERSGTIVTLGLWEALICVVPPTANYRFRLKMQLPDKPPRPMVTYETVTGVNETVEALPETKEYNEWFAQMEIWKAEAKRVSTENAIAGAEFAYDYAILGWRKVGTDDWLEEPPEDWEVPTAYARHNVATSGNRRLEFIINELLITDEYAVAARAVMYPALPGTERDTSPITREEVVAAKATFQAGDELPISTRRMGTSAGEGIRKQHKDERPSVSAAAGRSQRKGSGWLVRLFKRGKNTDAGT